MSFKKNRDEEGLGDLVRGDTNQGVGKFGKNSGGFDLNDMRANNLGQAYGEELRIQYHPFTSALRYATGIFK